MISFALGVAMLALERDRRRPVFAMALVPSAPMNEATLATSGSCRTTVAADSWSSIMRVNDTSGGARDRVTRPVPPDGRSLGNDPATGRA